MANANANVLKPSYGFGRFSFYYAIHMQGALSKISSVKGFPSDLHIITLERTVFIPAMIYGLIGLIGSLCLHNYRSYSAKFLGRLEISREHAVCCKGYAAPGTVDNLPPPGWRT